MSWASPVPEHKGSIDLEVVEESALAIAQSTMQSAMDDAGLSRSDVSGRLGKHRSFITRILGGQHNLTIKTLARFLAACGLEIDLRTRPLQWGWAQETPPKSQPKPAGNEKPDDQPKYALAA